MRTIKLCRGAGNGIDSACLMTAVSIVSGAKIPDDKPSCVCPTLRAFIIKCNDSMPDNLRSELFTPLIWELPGTVTTLENQILRARVFAHGAQILATYAATYATYAANAAADATASAAYATAYAANATAYAAAYAASAANATANAAYAASATANAANATANAANATSKREVYEYCVTLICIAMSIGDKRPVEIVKTPKQLAEMLK